ncbi:DUF3306 domain-containing protein [Roseomonas frigidaquae]|uniref:DUF3306 domain-containing protein n=1 Tax=Falsiroseomonas frigidaquae TaxID=487318 RepID=A0ABX1F2A2_9PROT|nr:DUF3306 domain-containing protein [Falsiroseomonas frigidaquae]NKE46472.1 DUF3306 domain-containing protein [Falsiroseomonas frigidaquae]
MSDAEDGFLSRWSRLKRRPEPEVTPGPDVTPEPEVTPGADAMAEGGFKSPAPQACPIPGVPEIDLSALPRIEDLTESSDFTLFLRPGVPAALRGAALRRMWSLDPTIRDFIGPADYAWDYNNPAGMPPGFSLDIGGKLKELLAQAIGERPEGEAPQPGPSVATAEEAAAPQLAAEADHDAEYDEGGEVASVPDALQQAALPAEDPPVPRRRHGGAMPG